MLDTMRLNFGPRPQLRDTRERLAALRFEHLEAKPLAPALGAEIRGVDLAAPPSSVLLAELRRALVEFKVIFFRDQDLDVIQQAKFAAHFGELEEHPFLPSNTEQKEVITFAKDEGTVGVENIWHSDVSWREIPSLGSMLRAIHVPDVGGDTVWADMEAAYDGLADDVKQRLDGLIATHDFVKSFGRAMTKAQREERRREFPAAHHPVIRTHPESGRKSIYVNAIFTSHIEDIPEAESDELLLMLYAQASCPEYQVRFQWAPGSVAFWDNRSTQHYAINDYWPNHREMDRVTVIGDVPV